MEEFHSESLSSLNLHSGNDDPIDKVDSVVEDLGCCFQPEAQKRTLEILTQEKSRNMTDFMLLIGMIYDEVRGGNTDSFTK